MSNCLNVLSPAWVLRESFVKIDVLVRKREPVVLRLQTTGNQVFLVEVTDLCVLRIVILEPSVLFQTLELVRPVFAPTEGETTVVCTLSVSLFRREGY